MVHQHTNKTFINPPVNAVGNLPLVGYDGELRFVVSEGSLYRYDLVTAVWINVGVPGTGSFFADGSVPAEADFNMAGFDLMNVGQLTSASGLQLDLLSKVTNSASAIVLNIDTVNAITTAGAKLLSIKVQGVEKFVIDKDGLVTVGGGLTSVGNVNAFIDSDNNDPSETFTIYHNVSVPTPGFELFQVRANGEVEIYGGPLIGGASPFTFKSKEANGASAVGFGFETNNSLTTNGSKIFRLKNASNEVFNTRLGTNLRGETAQQLFEYFDDTGTRTRQEAHFFDTGFSSREVQDFVSANRHIFWHSNDFSQGPLGETVFIDSAIDSTSASLEQWVQSLDGGGGYAGYAAVNMYGDATSRGVLQLQAYDDSGDNIDFNITTEDQSALSLTNVKGLFSVNGTNVLALAANGDVAIGGILYGGSSPFKLKSREPNGASAIGFELDTINSLSTSGAKLLSLKNNGTEKFAIDKDGNIITGGGSFAIVVEPSAGGVGIQSAINTLGALGGGMVQLKAGTYTLSSSIAPTTGWDNIILRGVGDATILNHDGSSAFIAISWAGSSVTSSLVSPNPIAGDTSITFVTTANAALVQTGDMVRLTGLGSDGENEIEVNEAAANGGGGIVTLKYPVKRSMTSVTTNVYRGGKNLRLENFRLTSSAPFAGVTGLQLNYHRYGQVDNITIDSLDNAIGIQYSTGWKNIISNCRIRDLTTSTSYGINSNTEIESTIKGCSFINVPTPIRQVFSCHDLDIIDNRLYKGTTGILVDALSGGITRRLKISDNKITEFTLWGIRTLATRTGSISSNALDRCSTLQSGGDTFAIATENSYNFQVEGNTIKEVGQGIYISGEDCLVANNSIMDVFGRPSSAYGQAIEGYGSKISIVGNTIRNCTKVSSTALVFFGTTGIGLGATVANNTIDSIAGVGIDVGQDSGTGAGHVVMGNVCRNTTTFGLRIGNNVTDSIIMGNNCIGMGISEGTGTGNDFVANKS